MKLIALLLFAVSLFAQPAGWSWVNQGTSTLDTSNGSWYVAANAVANTHSVRAIVKSTPSGSYSVTVKVSMLAAATSQWDAMTGIVFRESSSGKLTTCELETFSGNALAWYINAVYWTSATTPSAGVGSQIYRVSGDGAMIRAGDDGTNRTCDLTVDSGGHWINFYTQSRTATMTANQIGVFVDNWEGSRTGAFAGLLTYWADSWSSDSVAELTRPLPGAPGSLSGWTTTNGGSATLDDSTGAFYAAMTSPSSGQYSVLLTKSTSGTFSTVAYVGATGPSNGTYWDLPTGIVFRESSSGKFITCQFENDPDGWFYSATYWASGPNALPTSDPVTEYYRASMNSGIIRGRDDGTNRYCDVSLDAYHWLTFYTQARTLNITADAAGFFGSTTQGNAGLTSSAVLFGWSGL